MAKLSDLKTSENLKVLLYGASGTGKTCYSVSAPGPIFVFDFDGKISSAKKFLESTQPGKIDEIEFEQLPLAKTANTYERFQALLSRMEELAAKGEFKWKTIVVDSITMYSDALMAGVIRQNPGVKRYNANIPVMQDYLFHTNYFKQDMGRLLSLPCNVICLGHITTEKDEHTGEIIHKPLLSGKLADHLPRIFTEVWRSFVDTKDGKHKAQTRSDGKFICRTEIPGLPQIVPLDYSVILNALRPKQ